MKKKINNSELEYLWNDPDINLMSDFEILFAVKQNTTSKKTPTTTTVVNQQNNNIQQNAPKIITIKQGEIIGTRMNEKVNTQTQANATFVVKERESFTLEKLKNAIATIIEQIKSQQVYYSAIKNATITLDGETINIGLISNADLQLLKNNFREWLKNQLCLFLHNGHIIINYYKQEMSQSVRVQTETEIFNNLLKDNKLFKKLVETLELELEF